jgi:hypothetical protein
MVVKATLMMYTAEYVPLSGRDARATSLGPGRPVLHRR